MSFFPSIFGSQKDTSAASLKTQIDKVFDNFFEAWPEKSMLSERLPGFFSPAVDIAETKEGVEVKVDLPDMDKKDIHLELHNDHLLVSGEKHLEKEDKKEKGYHVMERAYGSFRRAIPLPFSVDDSQTVNATYDKGVLNVMIAKPSEQAVQKNKIDIN